MSRAHGSCNTTSRTLASIAVEVIVSLNFMLSQRISHASGYQCPDSNISHWGGGSGSGSGRGDSGSGMRMEQYHTHTDYALWEVIVNGDAPAVASASAEGPIPPKTAEQKLSRKNELKAKALYYANLKLLRSLPSTWNNIALIMRNKSDLDILCMDDLYNNLKVYEAEIKGQSSSSSNSQNVDFVSSKNTSSTNEVVNTAHEVSTTSSKG
ncbi:hypothetical protein Tco_1303877 [Tanacetum coccineum]